jgi:hypothetical protein
VRRAGNRWAQQGETPHGSTQLAPPRAGAVGPIGKRLHPCGRRPLNAASSLSVCGDTRSVVPRDFAADAGMTDLISPIEVHPDDPASSATRPCTPCTNGSCRCATCSPSASCSTPSARSTSATGRPPATSSWARRHRRGTVLRRDQSPGRHPRGEAQGPRNLPPQGQALRRAAVVGVARMTDKKIATPRITWG